MKKIYFVLIFYLFIFVGNGFPNMEQQSKKLDDAIKKEMIDKITEIVLEKYVFPDSAKKIAEYLRERFEAKAYEGSRTINEFAQNLTRDMRKITNDRHVGIMPGRRSSSGDSQDDRWKKSYIKRMSYQNFGLKKIERLLGNVGCIVLDEFAYTEIDGEDVGGGLARVALRFVSNCDALIFDLRDNFGGRDEMALLFLNHFFEKPEHILTSFYRQKNEEEIWTAPVKAKDLLSQIPLYVLTSSHTVSGGEMFAYVLKNRKRATIIGEKTLGAAHKTHFFPIPIQEYNISIALPVGRVIDPITGSDWEGNGVEPDILVSSGKAMDVAYKKALEYLIKSKKQRSERYEREWALAEVEARLEPIILSEKNLEECVGAYGERRIMVEDGILVYQKEGSPAYKLKPMSKDMFSFEDKGMFYVRIKFVRDESGNVDKMILLYDTGQRGEYKKNKE